MRKLNKIHGNGDKKIGVAINCHVEWQFPVWQPVTKLQIKVGTSDKRVSCVSHALYRKQLKLRVFTPR